jgi:predicted secreted protein
MSITSAIVLFAVIWFMVLFLILPLRMVTQGDAGDVVPGTPSSAPQNADMGRKLRLTTIIAVVAWVVIAGTILSGVIDLRDLDWFNRLPPAPAGGGTGG